MWLTVVVGILRVFMVFEMFFIGVEVFVGKVVVVVGRGFVVVRRGAIVVEMGLGREGVVGEIVIGRLNGCCIIADTLMKYCADLIGCVISEGNRGRNGNG